MGGGKRWLGLAYAKGFWVGWQNSVFPDQLGGYFIIAMCLLYKIS